MKLNKKSIFALLLSLTLLSSCSQNAPSESEETSTIPDSNQSAQLIEYYQAELSKLESSIITMKEEFYIAEKQYEDSIANLTSQLQSIQSPENNQPELEDISLIPFSYILNEEKAVLVKYTESSPNVTVPSKIQGHKVSKIGEYCFGADTISVIISEGVEEIDWFAFANCTRLCEIYIPLSVKMINYGAFDNCPKTFTIRCKKGSYAEAYAKSYGYNCIAE